MELSFQVTKLLSMALYPLSQVLVLGLIALLLVYLDRRRGALAVISASVAWLYLASTALMADFLMGTLETDQRPKAMSVIPTAEAIVLLGGAFRGDTHWRSYLLL